MNILSIQSHVAYGHVGNAAAVFPIQRMGHDVWPIHTVQFSNHTGYGAWRGQVFDAGLIGDCVLGIAERGVLGSCDGVLSGYMGSADTGSAILDGVGRVRAANPAALKKLVIGGAELRAFPQDLLEAAFKASGEVYKEISDANPRFKAMLDAATAFRADQYLWWQVSEYTFDNFMIRQRARG